MNYIIHTPSVSRLKKKIFDRVSEKADAARDTFGRLQDKNSCEQADRPFTNLQKSFGGFSSELDGEVAAAWLTFVESCKLQKSSV